MAAVTCPELLIKFDDGRGSAFDVVLDYWFKTFVPYAALAVKTLSLKALSASL